MVCILLMLLMLTTIFITLIATIVTNKYLKTVGDGDAGTWAHRIAEGVGEATGEAYEEVKTYRLI